MTNPTEIVGALKQAIGSGDFAGARKRMHDDMTFRGPERTSDMSVARIAELVGHESEVAFGRAFRRHVGASPAAFRRDALA